jgi:alcohol dehydrogenase (cytochrome c)
MRAKKIALVILAAVILVSICAPILYRQPHDLNSVLGLESRSNERIWKAISCRAGLYLRKGHGEVPEISWSELWELTLPNRGFYCAEGRSFDASLQYSSIASEDDRKAGARIFHERCTGCHGNDGAGGPVGPSLTRSQYKHGDSDLSVYKDVRDGIPGTVMPSANLPPHELLRITAHVKMLQAHLSEADEPEVPPAIQVSSERLQAAGTNTQEWLMYSGSYNGWRHTSLAQITPANVAQLRLRWIKQFDTSDSNIEGTPLVVDGVIFMVADAWHVLALNAKTGDLIWEYKRTVRPDLPLEFGSVNRGLAVYGSTIFFGSLDGYLVAINANDGKVIWERSVANSSGGYSISGAPLVVNRSVIVGIAGGEFRIRGFLAACDVSSGEQQWRFDTIPEPGEVGHETWKNEAWRTGSGATWVTGSYDPSTEAQTPVLADLLIAGLIRKVILWPNRNGSTTCSTESRESFWPACRSLKLIGREGLPRRDGRSWQMLPTNRRLDVVQDPALPAGRTGKTPRSTEVEDLYLSRQPRVLRSSLNSQRIRL